jgi:hypothetical protein
LTPNPTIATPGLDSLQQRTFALIIVVVAFVFTSAFLYGQSLRATSERNKATATAEESMQDDVDPDSR